MVNQLFAVASVLFFLSTAVLGSEDVVAPTKLRNRHLQDLSPLCNAFLEPIFEGQSITCSCTPILIPDFSFSASCVSVEPLCLNNLICVSPEVTASIDVTGKISFDVCLYEITVLGIPLYDNLCIGSLDDLLNPAADSAGCEAVAETREGKSACQSCTICPGGGYTFDCSNINEQLVSSTCTGYYPTSFGDVSNLSKVGVPLLDGVR